MKRKAISILITLVLISAIIVLGVQNLELRKKNRLLNIECRKIAGLKFQPFVVPMTEKIILGEEYSAAIFVTAISENNLPIVTTIDSIGDRKVNPDSFVNSIKYDSDHKMFIYHYTPKSKGNYVWRGSMISNYSGIVDTVYFESNYTVD